MIPLSDDNPTLRPPLMTWLLLGVTWGTWVLVQGMGLVPEQLAASICNLGMLPGEVTKQAAVGSGIPMSENMACLVDDSPVNWLTPLTSMFLHGGWGHIIGNSLFFWVFGNNIEDSMGRLRFLVFYILCGLAAAGVHVLTDPASPIPTVGASGAISGVMGGYLLLYPKVRVNMLFIIVIFIRVIPLPAWLVLLWWFALQVVSGLPSLLDPSPENVGGVAVWAHVGGFAAGVVLVKLFENHRLVEQRTVVRHRLHPEHP
jgi:membrane associated rhomboid family serine protease